MFEFKGKPEPVTTRQYVVAVTGTLIGPITKLQSAWSGLDDIAKGEAIADLQAEGISCRDLGNLFGRS